MSTKPNSAYMTPARAGSLAKKLKQFVLYYYDEHVDYDHNHHALAVRINTTFLKGIDKTTRTSAIGYGSNNRGEIEQLHDDMRSKEFNIERDLFLSALRSVNSEHNINIDPDKIVGSDLTAVNNQSHSDTHDWAFIALTLSEIPNSNDDQIILTKNSVKQLQDELVNEVAHEGGPLIDTGSVNVEHILSKQEITIGKHVFTNRPQTAIAHVATFMIRFKWTIPRKKIKHHDVLQHHGFGNFEPSRYGYDRTSKGHINPSTINQQFAEIAARAKVGLGVQTVEQKMEFINKVKAKLKQRLGQ